MQRTVEALVYPDGTIEVQEPITGTTLRRAVLTILDEPDDKLPDELEQAIAPLFAFDDAALWEAARSRLPVDAAERLEALHFKRQREGLTDFETQETELLVRAYERAVLVRAQAAALLKQRGHDVSVLLVQP